jgi:hypothetical protein
MKANIQRKRKRVIPIAIAIIAILLIAGAIAFYFFGDKLFNSNGSTDGNSAPNDTNTVNLDPPTQQEVDESQQGKQDIIDNDDKDTDTDSVEVGVASAFNTGEVLDIRAFVPGVIEGDGKCTATLTRNNLTVTRTVDAFIDARTTQCRANAIPLSEFSQSGIWNLVVSYQSSKHSGTSSKMEVEI